MIGSDTMSRIIDYTDRGTCVLFGDGAGAMLIEPLAADDDPRLGFIDFLGEIDGSGGDYLKMPAGGSRLPASSETVATAAALRASGRPAGVQVRGAQDVRSLQADCWSATACPRKTWMS